MTDVVSTTQVGDVRAPVAVARRWRTEEWIAVILGFVVIAKVVPRCQSKVVDLPNLVPTFRWTTDSQIAAMTPGWIDTLDSIARDAEAKGQQNAGTLSRDLKGALEKGDRKAIAAAAGKMAALGRDRKSVV